MFFVHEANKSDVYSAKNNPLEVQGMNECLFQWYMSYKITILLTNARSKVQSGLYIKLYVIYKLSISIPNYQICAKQEHALIITVKWP